MNKKQFIKDLVSESKLLDRFLKSKGIDPRFVSVDSKVSHSKSGEFAKWKRDRFDRFTNNLKAEQVNMDGQGKTTERQAVLNKRKQAQNEIPTPSGPGSHNEEVEIDEASTPAQQAAIAIRMKEKGYKSKVEKKPKGEYERKVDKYLKKKYAKEDVEHIDEADIYSIKNTKTGQIYHHSKYPITSKTKVYQQIKSKPGHEDATIHKNGKPVKEEIELDESKVKPIKVKIKDPTPTAAERLHARHQEIRKKSGLPDPSEYEKKLKKEDTFQDSYAATQTVSDGGNTPDDVTMKKERSKSARMIKSIYKRKNMKEDIYDHEKDDKSIETDGKKPKVTKVDKDVGSISSKPQAFAVLSGGKTMTGQPRDTIEIDPLLRVRPGQVEPTVKKVEKK